ncbi:MAG: Na(+)/H(+) antiporter subunit B [Deinococcus sp.]|nr:Na(+)/H(+) antiporter subunit B [Deinococcus sp.]
MRPSPILLSVARVSLHLMLLFAIYLFWRGHNAPGGGFIAGLVTAGAVVLQFVAFGRELVLGVLPGDLRQLAPWGLALALCTGLVPLLWRLSFLRSGYVTLDLGGLGELDLVSAALFDLGVYLVVVGITLTIVDLLGGEAE